MAKIWPQAPLNEALWALECEGVKLSEIHQIIRRGEAGLKPLPGIPKRTVQNRLAALRRERNKPQPIEPGGETDAIAALRRQVIVDLQRERNRLARIKSKTAQDRTAMRDLVRQVEEMTRTERGAASASTRHSRARKAGGVSETPGGLLSRLEAMERKDAIDRSEGEPASETQASNGKANAGSLGADGEADGGDEEMSIPTQREAASDQPASRRQVAGSR